MNRLQGYYFLVAILLITEHKIANAQSERLQSDTDSSLEGSTQTPSEVTYSTLTDLITTSVIQTGYTSGGNTDSSSVVTPLSTTDVTFTATPQTGITSEGNTDTSSAVTPLSTTDVTSTATPRTNLTNLTVGETTQCSIHISWESDSNNVLYTVVYTELSCDSNESKSDTTKDKQFTATYLRAGYSYSFHVSTANGNQLTATAVTNEAAPSGPPTNMSIEHISAKGVRFTWNDVACASRNGKTLGYQLTFRNLTHCGGEPEAVVRNISANDSDALTLELTELTPGINYSFSLVAINSAGCSIPHTWTVVTNESEPSGPPTGVSVNHISSRGVTFSWTDVTCQSRNGITIGYQLTFRNVTHCSDDSLVDVIRNITANDSNPLTLEVSDLTPGIRYSFSLVAVNSAGPSVPHTWTVATNDSEPSGPPTNVSVNHISSSGFSFSWTDVTCQSRNGITLGYQLTFRNLTHCADGHQEEVIRNITVNNSNPLTLELTELTPGIQYNFTLVAVNSAGRSVPHTWTVATNDSPPSGPPSNVSVSHISSRGLSFSWSDVTCQSRNGITLGYQFTFRNVTHCADDHPDEVIQNITANDSNPLTLELTELTPGINYSFTLVAVNSAGRSVPYTWTAATNESEPSGPPSKVSVSHISSRSVSFSWSDVSCQGRNGITLGYQLTFRNLTHCADSNFEEVVRNITANDSTPLTLELTELTPGINYSFSLVAVNSAGRSVPHRWTVATMESAPHGPPSNVSVSHISSRGVSFSWSDVSCQSRNGVTLGYQLTFSNLTHCADGHPKEVIRNITANDSNPLTLELTELTPGINYSFSLLAVNSVGNSVPYTWAVATKESEPSGPPSNVSVSHISSRDVSFSWSDVSCLSRNGITLGYQLTLTNLTHCGKGDPEKVIRNITANVSETLTLQLTELTPGITYNVSLVAINSAGASVAQLLTVSTKESESSGPPTAFFARHISSRGINLSWKDVACQSRNGYTLGYQLTFRNLTHCGDGDTMEVTRNITANDSDILKLELSDLTPGITYNFSLVAVNSAGTSVPQSLTVATNESVPGISPSTVNVVYVSSRIIALTWQEVACQYRNGKILQYQLSFKNATHCGKGFPEEVIKSITAIESEPMSYELTGLTPGILYNFTIVAVNSAGGSSVAHSWSVATKEAAPEDVPKFEGCYFENWLIKLQWNTSDCGLSNGQVFYELKWEAPGEIGSEIVTTNSQSIGNLSYSKTYSISLRAGTKGGFYDGVSLCKVSTPDPPIDAGLIAGATVGAVVAVVVVCAAAAFVFRRRRSKFRKTQTRSIGEVRTIPAFPSNPEPNIIRNRPIKFSRIEQHVNAMHSDSNFAFCTEYKELKELSPKHPTTAARIEANVTKNRFVDILPFDHNRVKLLPSEDEDCSDYINASYLPGNASQRDYIATQGPLPGTLDGFWQMMWEQNVTLVVMLTQLIEKGKRKCEQYWPEALREPQQFGEIQVVKTLEKMKPDYTIRQMEMHLGDKVRHLVQYHYTAWPDHGCPQSTDTILDFVKAVQLRKPRGGQGPTVVHCSAGVGRTGTYICIERILKMMESDSVDEVDIFAMVLSLRDYRARIVQTEDQYVYLHDCIKDAFVRRQNSLNTESTEYVNFGGPSSGSPDEW